MIGGTGHGHKREARIDGLRRPGDRAGQILILRHHVAQRTVALHMGDGCPSIAAIAWSAPI